MNRLKISEALNILITYFVVVTITAWCQLFNSVNILSNGLFCKYVAEDVKYFILHLPVTNAVEYLAVLPIQKAPSSDLTQRRLSTETFHVFPVLQSKSWCACL
jgi:hypothetical protein